MKRAGLVWHHLPIRDLGVPDAAFEDAWRVTGPQLCDELEAGGGSCSTATPGSAAPGWSPPAC